MPTKKSTKKNEKDVILKVHDKEVMMKDLRRTLKDLGRLPRLIFAPVLLFIEKKYDHLPDERKKKLAAITEDIKKNGKGGLDKLKEWFRSAKSSVTTGTKKVAESKTVKAATEDGKKVAKAAKKKASSAAKKTTKATTNAVRGKTASAKKKPATTKKKPVSKKPAPKKKLASTKKK